MFSVHFFLNYCFSSIERPRTWIFMIYFCILINKRIIFAKNLKKRSHLHVVPGITVFKGFIQEIIAWGPPHSGILSAEKNTTTSISCVPLLKNIIKSHNKPQDFPINITDSKPLLTLCSVMQNGVRYNIIEYK